MAKKKLSTNQRKKRDRKRGPLQNKTPEASATWQDSDGLHAIMPGERPSEEKIAEMTRTYQQQIKKSPLFKEWVAKFGKKEALKLLNECRVKVK
jgi:antirestriction protein